MPRTQKIIRPGDTSAGEVVDTLLLKFADRTKQHGFVFGGKGTVNMFEMTKLVSKHLS